MRSFKRSAPWLPGVLNVAGLLALGCVAPHLGCTPSEDALSGGRPKVVIPANNTGTTTPGRRKIVMPPPMPPPPKPDGQPQRPEDLRKAADGAKAGTVDNRPGAPKIVKLDDHRLKVGATTVDLQTRRIEIPARVNMVRGILEYYACMTGGKLHESVIETLDKASDLHVALLLLGLNSAEYAHDPGTGMRRVRDGGKVRLFVEWVDPKTSAPQRKPAEAWLFNRKARSAPPPQNWSFQGSAFFNGDYSADQGKSVVGLIPDPTVVIGIEGDAGNPYRGVGLGYEVNTNVIPPKGTLVTLAIEAVTPAAAPPSAAHP